MEKFVAEYPYDGYYAYKGLNKNMNRQIVILYLIDKFSGLKRKTMSYARYLMSVKEGRILTNEEEIDHIDNDKTNDSIDNLQILTKTENLQKQVKFTNHGVIIVLLRCPWCGKMFERNYYDTHMPRKNRVYTACSKSCYGKFSIELVKHPNSKFVQHALMKNVLTVYRAFDYK